MHLFLSLVGFACAKIYFRETFDSGKLDPKWVISTAKDYGTWSVTSGKVVADAKASLDNKFYAISAKFDSEFDHRDKTFVVQFSARHEQGLDCGGGYVKILPKPVDQAKFSGETKYNVMFGPDICGTSKVHAILHYGQDGKLIKRNVSPLNDQLTHVYTFVIKPDQTYSILVDLEEKQTGSFEEDWDLLPPKTINDPLKSKPSDWVENPKDKKPKNYDDIPEFIEDADAKEPQDWDEDMDGEWEAPKKPNPDYQGEWKPRQIDNPDYKGPWVHPQIPNPEYTPNPNIYAYKSAYIGFDLWQVKAGTVFDNIIITDDLEEALAFGKETFSKFKDAEKKALDKIKSDETKLAEKKEAPLDSADSTDSEDEDDDDEHEDL